jgi:two-component system chemotaxis sensor kinase CheA
MALTLQQKLFNAFDTEQKEALGKIRANLQDLEKQAPADAQARLEEAFRMAHSLKGASRVVDLTEVNSLAHRLESLFSLIRQGKVALKKEVLDLSQHFLDGIEDSVACHKAGTKSHGLPAGVSEAVDALITAGSAAAAVKPAASAAASPAPMVVPAFLDAAVPAPAAADTPKASASAPAGASVSDQTLRLNASHLDRMLRTAGELLTSNRSQDSISTSYYTVERRLKGLQSELRRFRKDPVRVEQNMDYLEREISGLFRELSRARRKHQTSNWNVKQLGGQLQDDVKKARMVPAESIFEGFHKMVRDLAREEGKQVDFRAEGMDVEADRVVLQALKDPVMHMLRNSLSHGLETPPQRTAAGKSPGGTLRLRLNTFNGKLNIFIEDDGRGVNYQRIREKAVAQGMLSDADAKSADEDTLTQLIFEPGFSTAETLSDISGRGMGLSVVQETLRKLKGGVELHSEPGVRTEFFLSVPNSISTHHVVSVVSQGRTYGIPAYGIDRLVRAKSAAITTVDNKPTIFLDEVPLRVVSLGELVGHADAKVQVQGDKIAIVILKSGTKRLAVAVDEFAEECEALVKELSTNALTRLAHVMGAMLQEDGTVCIVLNPQELIDRQKRLSSGVLLRAAAPAAAKAATRILVVDDSFTTRTLEKSILEAHGFHVTLAVDGTDALLKLKMGSFDLMISDVEMPKMDGFTLVGEVRKNSRTAKMPIIMVTSLEKPEDKARGLGLGANAYLLKQQFDQGTLLDTIKQIL